MTTLTDLDILAYRHGAQLLLGRDPRGVAHLAVHTPAPIEGLPDFLVVPLAPAAQVDYLAGQVDLRTVMLDQGRQGWFRARWGQGGDSLIMHRQRHLLSEMTAGLPGAGRYFPE